MEAGGIEPPSRNNPNGSLYMLSLVFCCRPRRRSRAIFAEAQTSLSRSLTNVRIRKPAHCFSADQSWATQSYRGCLLLGSHTNRTGFVADLACNIIVGSYDLLTCLTRPSERPGHATATVVIRSKPIAPGGLIVQRATSTVSMIAYFGANGQAGEEILLRGSQGQSQVAL
jgi:hypothetical protein